MKRTRARARKRARARVRYYILFVVDVVVEYVEKLKRYKKQRYSISFKKKMLLKEMLINC